MDCRAKWSARFCVMQLNRSFMSGDYKKHRSNLLADSEISKLSESMEAASRRKEVKVLEQRRAKIYEERQAIINEADKLLEKAYAVSDQIRTLENKKSKATERKKFIMPCPDEGCRGFLSSQYKCEICKKWACPHCLVVLGEQKPEDHQCDPGTKASAELIKKETKPCPSCGTRISKIDGCDQMWCTECHTAFSWRTGEVETGVVHNPHFYQFQRTLKDGDEPPPNRAFGQCNDRLPPYYELRSYVLKPMENWARALSASSNKICAEAAEEVTALSEWLHYAHHAITHLNHAELEPHRRTLRHLVDNEDLRINFILSEIDKDGLMAELATRDTKRRRLADIVDVLDVIVRVAKEHFTALVNAPTNDMPAFIKMATASKTTIEALKVYCRKQLAMISATYNCTVPPMELDRRFHKAVRCTLTQAREIMKEADMMGAVENVVIEEGSAHN